MDTTDIQADEGSPMEIEENTGDVEGSETEPMLTDDDDPMPYVPNGQIEAQRIGLMADNEEDVDMPVGDPG